MYVPPRSIKAMHFTDHESQCMYINSIATPASWPGPANHAEVDLNNRNDRGCMHAGMTCAYMHAYIVCNVVRTWPCTSYCLLEGWPLQINFSYNYI